MSIERQLPERWRWVKFGDVAREASASTRTPIEDGFVHYIGLDHFDPDSLSLKRWGIIEEGNPTFTKVFRAGQLLFGRRRAYQRKAAIADFDGICSGDIIVIEAIPEFLLPDLLPFIVQSDGFWDNAIHTSAGSLSPRTKWANLAAYEFPLPPLDEQHRIAEILWAVEETYEAYNKCLHEIEILRRTSLATYVLKGTSQYALVETPIGRLPQHWKVSRIRQVGEVTLGRQRAPQHHKGEFMRPYLRVANVFDGYIDVSDVLEMNFTPEEYEIFSLREGDILLNEGQSRELVGRSSIFKNEIENCCFQNTLVRFRSGPEVIPEYAQAFFQYSFYEGAFAAIALQTTSIAHLGATRFGALYMPVPPLKEQYNIVEQISAIQTRSDTIKRHLVKIRRQKQALIEHSYNLNNA